MKLVKPRVLFVDYSVRSLNVELEKRHFQVSFISSLTLAGRLSVSSFDNFDLVYFAKAYPPFWNDLGIVLRRSYIPLIYGCHAPAVIFYPFMPKNHIENAVALTKLFYMASRKTVSAFHVLNSTDYNIINNCLRFKSYFVPIGVDTQLFNIGNRSERFTVVFVGPRWGKGVDMLMKILPAVIKRIPDVKFVLCGDGFLNHYFEQLTETFKKNVEFRGFLPQDGFANLLGSSHLLLSLSRFESFGLSMIQALSCGVPVVSFKIPGVPTDVLQKENIGTLIRPFKLNKIVDSIVEYYELWRKQPAEFSRLNVECRHVASKFDWTIVAPQFASMFRDTLEQ